MKINEIIVEGKDSDPCWDNYKQVGMKKKNGKKVPNCVPKESVSESQLEEEINPDIRNPEFKHDQQIGDYLYTAKTEIEPHSRLTWLTIRCYDGKLQIGRVLFDASGRSSLVSIGTRVNPEYRNQGIASTMYAYARMLGNTIEPSHEQLTPGKKMWAAWKKSGDDKHLRNESVAEGSQLEETYNDDDEFFEAYGIMEYNDEMINESEYQGRKVTLNKPFRTSGGPKKFSVYVKNEKGNVVKVNFGDPKSKIKKHIPGRRANFRARHNCDSPGPKTSARYWSCRNW